MKHAFYTKINRDLEQLKEEGLYKHEREITSVQKAKVMVSTGEQLLNFCANNYLGLASDPVLIDAAKKGLDSHGFGVASVRFICGTQDIHKQLERKLSDFLGTEDSILYSSCFDANTGLFETILDDNDAIISDALNHASIIDGVRLCKAKRYRYNNNDMSDLEAQLIAADEAGVRTKLIVTDGVFSMDGVVANLPVICDLADKYQAIVVVDDSHAVGFMGDKGAGTPQFHGVMDRIDILTGTLGKAMGGASGGYVAGKKELIDWLRQRSRPYLFSNSLVPAVVSAAICAIDLISEQPERRQRLWENVGYFRQRMTEAGFSLAGADHAIIPIMLGDAKIASQFAQRAMEKGIYVTGFSFPVVPKGGARIRTQMSAAHSREDLDKAIDAFIEIGREMKVIA